MYRICGQIGVYVGDKKEDTNCALASFPYRGSRDVEGAILSDARVSTAEPGWMQVYMGRYMYARS